ENKWPAADEYSFRQSKASSVVAFLSSSARYRSRICCVVGTLASLVPAAPCPRAARSLDFFCPEWVPDHQDSVEIQARYVGGEQTRAEKFLYPAVLADISPLLLCSHPVVCGERRVSGQLVLVRDVLTEFHDDHGAQRLLHFRYAFMELGG